jgi:hypothetical protein
LARYAEDMKLNVFSNGWASVILIAAGIPLAAVGLAVASSLPDYFSLASTSVFAVILLASLVVNLSIALAWRPWRPLLLVVPTALPLVQSTLLVLEIVWILAIVTDSPLVGVPAGAAIAAVSIAAFVMTVVPDSIASSRSLERQQKRAAVRDARTPAERRRRRIRAGVITGTLFAAVAVPVIVVQSTVTVHPGCNVNGSVFTGGTIIVSSTDCGDFARPGFESDYDDVAGDFGTFDVVTRGYWLGHPLLVELRPVGG